MAMNMQLADMDIQHGNMDMQNEHVAWRYNMLHVRISTSMDFETMSTV
jgi:hypothetical protein